MSKTIIVCLSILFLAQHASAELAAKSYVDVSLSKMVSTEQSATQTLQGHYSITGTIEVETPKLPTALN